MSLLVFLHGLGQTPQSWQNQVSAMPAGMTAEAPWLRGTKPGDDADFTVRGAADDVLALLNRHGVEQFALCGLSLGAVVALDIATRAPETVSHLVLAAGMVKPPAMLFGMQHAMMRLLPQSKFVRTGIAKAEALRVMSEVKRADYRADLHRVTAKTLVLIGDQDPANRAGADQLATGIAGARLEVLRGAGHELNVADPSRFNVLLYRFLTD